MNVIAFDVDETLACSHGPISQNLLVMLHERGHVVGLCGNWAVAVREWPQWHRFLSFVGPMLMSKPDFLRQIKTHVPANGYILVGNDHARGAYSSPDDAALARLAGWQFISEIDFISQQQEGRT